MDQLQAWKKAKSIIIINLVTSNIWSLQVDFNLGVAILTLLSLSQCGKVSV